MSLPNANTVTNLYLYGQETTPSDKADDALIRDNLIRPARHSVDASEYMEGPGRFALPSMSPIVRDFLLNSFIN